MKWIDCTVDVHSEKEQIRRIDASSDVVFISTDRRSNSGITSEGYVVSLDSCTCEDFKKRQKPCSHIYALATKVKMMERKRIFNRSEKLIADFCDAFPNSKTQKYAHNWAFIVGTYNYTGLDILLTQRIVRDENGNRVIMNQLTQGFDYRFEPGTTFYDDIAAYELSWGEAKKVIDFYLVIHSSYPNNRFDDVTIKENILYVNSKFEYGTTVFDVIKINHNTDSMEKPVRYYCYNNEFVKLLQFGECISTTGEIIRKDDWKENNKGGNIA